MARLRVMVAWLGMVFAAFAARPAFAGEAASDFTLRDVNGAETTLSALKGKVVVLSFWATWCGPCKEEMPHLEKMYKDLGAKGLVVLSISTDDARSASRVKPFVMKMGYTFPVLLDRESTVIGAYNPSKTVPYTVVIDKNGDVVRRTTGYNPGDETELQAFLVSQLGG
ncbi:MAG: TlpA disulfide reductase family protein [Myxococcota bacterium]